jgi:phytoene dehydrogenase-like protein
MKDVNDVIVIGGGLGGLTVATMVARGGRRVVLFEKSGTLGGRAATQTKNGFSFNMGPHALYCRGHGARVLRELGVPFSGKSPSASAGYAVARGRKHTLPAGFLSLLSTGLFSLSAKLEVARLLGSIGKIDPQPLQSVTVRQWLGSSIRHPEVRQLVEALVRLATYANDPERHSAGAALAQLQLALAGNVLYLDGGWQTLVDGLRRAAEAAGVEIASGVRIKSIDHDGAVRGVQLADGTRRPAAAVIVATGPAEVCELFADGEVKTLRQRAESAIPVRAACLDIALETLPRPRALFALGIDRPLYLSVHSAVAKLAPEGAATIQVAKYLSPSVTTDPKSDEQELETLLDLVQPGWRDHLVERRFLPKMTVSNALVTAAGGGMAGRANSEVPEVRNAYVVGDWVGSEGMLADAVLASAKHAAELTLRGEATRAAA